MGKGIAQKLRSIIFGEQEPQTTKTPNELFNALKEQKTKTSQGSLDSFYGQCSQMAKRFIDSGQLTALGKVSYLMQCVEREKKAVELGIDEFIFRDDIEAFLDKSEIKTSSIKLIELEDYPRAIPVEIAAKAQAASKVFDQFYILFTDYTGSVTRSLIGDRRIEDKDKDPIMFGTFQTIESNEGAWGADTKRYLNDRFYVVGDWVDEYCDLTLEKLIEKTKPDLVHKIGVADSSLPTIKEIDSFLAEHEERDATNRGFNPGW